MDDFGRWNFKDDGLIKFALAIKTAEERETEKQEQKTPLKVLGLTVFTENRLRNGRVYDVETLQAMTNRDILAIPDMGKKALGEVLDALNAYAIDMSEKHVQISDKNQHEFFCPRCGHCCRDGLERLIRIMGTFDLATGHADTMDQALDALESELRDVLGYLRARREWVGLTDDEVFNIYKQFDSLQYKSFAKAIEAKLKELNA
jgi:hypothetical protein